MLPVCSPSCRALLFLNPPHPGHTIFQSRLHRNNKFQCSGETTYQISESLELLRILDAQSLKINVLAVVCIQNLHLKLFHKCSLQYHRISPAFSSTNGACTTSNGQISVFQAEISPPQKLKIFSCLHSHSPLGRSLGYTFIFYLSEQKAQQ